MLKRFSQIFFFSSKKCYVTNEWLYNLNLLIFMTLGHNSHDNYVPLCPALVDLLSINLLVEQRILQRMFPQRWRPSSSLPHPLFLRCQNLMDQSGSEVLSKEQVGWRGNTDTDRILVVCGNDHTRTTRLKGDKQWFLLVPYNHAGLKAIVAVHNISRGFRSFYEAKSCFSTEVMGYYCMWSIVTKAQLVYFR